MTVYVVSIGDGASETPGRAIDFPGEAVALTAGLFVCETGASQSRLYHDVKTQLPAGTPLFVGALADIPKFMGMAEGSTKAVRRIFGKD